VRDLLGPKVYAAQVKKSLNRYAIRTLTPSDACTLIEKTVSQALKAPKTWPKPLQIKSPVELKIELASPDKAKDFIGKTGCEIVGPRTVISRGKTFWQVWDQFWYQ